MALFLDVTSDCIMRLILKHEFVEMYIVICEQRILFTAHVEGNIYINCFQFIIFFFLIKSFQITVFRGTRTNDTVREDK